MKKAHTIDTTILKEYLSYNSDTGIIIWKKGIRKGKVAGRKHTKYNQITIQNILYSYSRVAYALYHNTDIPTNMVVEHKDGNIRNNRISNLRLATQQENCYNKALAKNNSSGYKGVSYSERNKAYRAVIAYKYKKYFLGYYKTAEEASAVYEAKAKELFGEYKRETY